MFSAFKIHFIEFPSNGNKPRVDLQGISFSSIILIPIPKSFSFTSFPKNSNKIKLVV